MVLLYNSFITDISPNGGVWEHQNISYDRGNLNTPSKFEVLKYSLSSIAKAYPWKRVIITVELDGNYNTEDNKKDLKEFIFQEFEGIEIYFTPKRNLFQEDWIKTYELINDEFIFYINNHDHIFLDSSKDYLKELEEKVKADGDYEYKTIALSHWPEFIRSAKCGYIEPYWVESPSKYNEFHPTKWNKNYKVTDDFISYKGNSFDSFNIITKKLYKNWFLKGNWNESAKINYPNLLKSFSSHQVEMSRTEGTGIIGMGNLKKDILKDPSPLQQIYIPYREVLRHFDGYCHQKITNDKCPAIDIPVGYFDKKMKIRFGYGDRKEDWVNIDPLNPNYYTCNKLGTDYKFTLNDLPYIWKDRIIEVDINPDIIVESEITWNRINSVVQMLFNDPRYIPHIDNEVKNNVLKSYFNRAASSSYKKELFANMLNHNFEVKYKIENY